jgi:outer membrane lipoprotein-sorting protein
MKILRSIWSAATRCRFPTTRHVASFQSVDLSAHSKVQFAVAAIIFSAVGAMAQTTNNLSDAEIQGRNLAQQLCDGQPEKSFTKNGILSVRNKTGQTINFLISFQTFVAAPGGWQKCYDVSLTNGLGVPIVSLTITHAFDKCIRLLANGEPMSMPTRLTTNIVLTTDETFIPFANSDFWIADLGLEFFHWPEQKILKRENSRGRVCKVLESTNPNPSTNGYSRVDSWIDEETLGIVQAYAYDAQGRKLKEFYPKDFKKVDGQWQVGMMEMDNVQTGSRSRIEFDLKK